MSEASDPDLMWALRGGGGNFGVVTRFPFRLHPVTTVTGGVIAHPIDAAPSVLRFYREASAGAPDDLTVFAGLTHAPDGSGTKIAAMVVCHAGDPEQAARDLEPLQSLRLPGDRPGRPDAVPGHEHAARRRLPEGRAQLLALDLRRAASPTR